MFKFKSVLVIMMVLMICVSFFGCEVEQDADEKQAEQTKELMSEANRQIGMPNIVNFQQKKLMKEIYELTDKENLITYAYIQSDYQGKLIFIGKCIGFGIPFSAQYTNPSRIVRRFGERYVLPQPDPNGLFMPTSSSATWLMLIDPETNKPRPVYFEPTVVVSPFKLKGPNIIG